MKNHEPGEEELLGKYFGKEREIPVPSLEFSLETAISASRSRRSAKRPLFFILLALLIAIPVATGLMLQDGIPGSRKAGKAPVFTAEKKQAADSRDDIHEGDVQESRPGNFHRQAAKPLQRDTIHEDTLHSPGLARASVFPVSVQDSGGIELKSGGLFSKIDTLLRAEPDPVKIYPHMFSVSVRGIALLSLFPRRPVGGNPGGFANNTALAFMYSLGKNSSLGIEIGKETFPIYIESGSGIYEQEQSLQWGGLAYRYTMDPLAFADDVQPFAQVLAGGTILGPASRLMLGIQWYPVPNVGLSSGAEAMTIFFNDGEAWQSAGKLSFSYGIIVRFN